MPGDLITPVCSWCLREYPSLANAEHCEQAHEAAVDDQATPMLSAATHEEYQAFVAEARGAIKALAASHLVWIDRWSEGAEQTGGPVPTTTGDFAFRFHMLGKPVNNERPEL